jgi:hypothetical protein
MYTAGVTANAASPGQAGILIGLLTAERALRVRAGFLDA